MTPGQAMVRYSVDHPRAVMGVTAALTIVLGAFIPLVKVDTDPENMLPEKAPVRVFHNAMKREFTLNDMVVVGIVNETDPDGVFNPDSLKKVYELTGYAKTLRWPDPKDPAKEIGVVTVDLLAPSTVDNIEQAGPGTVRFEWLMPEPPKTREEARAIRDKARSNPLLDGTLLSEDGKALCLYLPLTSKDLSYRVYKALKQKIKTLRGPEQYHITGLPVAEDTFGVEMFIQMAISAPLAMLVIFLLMYAFFRNTIVVLSTLIDATISVICTMGLLIATGHTVHIMSSMIPIFIMPIAVLDDVHLLSEFFDRYQKTRDRRATLLNVMRELFMPMLYTTLTTVAGFASLALAPIPPVQVFGIFVAFGVMMAWLCSVMVVPAYIMLLPEKVLEGFGAVHGEGHAEPRTPLTRLLRWVGSATYRHAKVIVATSVLATAVGVYGVTRIQINDNPTKWFARSHPIRIADHVLNKHFGGTYMAYLALEPEPAEMSAADAAKGIERQLGELLKEQAEFLPDLKRIVAHAREIAKTAGRSATTGPALLDTVMQQATRLSSAAEGDARAAWDEVALAVDKARVEGQIFKRPDVLRYIRQLQAALAKTRVVGKSNSVADVVRKVYRELMEGKDEYDRIPDTLPAVAQCLLSFQNSHDPDDLWHLVTPDYRKASLWVQLKSGDNKDMEHVKRSIDAFIASHPPPTRLKHQWFGLTYINVVWQDKMVMGMLSALSGSFVMVLIMMVVLYRSFLWGILSMLPLTVTIVVIYGLIGLVGKDYDMPVAVLSSLTLGLAVDYAIHFLSRARLAVAEHGTWEQAAGPMFGEPARAIARNGIVVALGFVPLLFATLVPYKTVGVFMASILGVSGLCTLFMLPALMTVMGKALFRPSKVRGVACHCAACIVTSVVAIAIVAYAIHHYRLMDWTRLVWIAVAAVSASALACNLLSRREACRRAENEGVKNETVDHVVDS